MADLTLDPISGNRWLLPMLEDLQAGGYDDDNAKEKYHFETETLEVACELL